jgi:hypothetical protein
MGGATLSETAETSRLYSQLAGNARIWTGNDAGKELL